MPLGQELLHQALASRSKAVIWIDDLYEEPNSLIPNASPSSSSAMVDQAIYAPLFFSDSTNSFHPGIANVIPTVANGDISPDLKTWTFHLRPNLKWTDGQPLDARDVDFTWKLWTNPKFPAASTVGLNLITSADVSSDNLSITFHLSQSFSPFLTVWVDGLNAPMPAHHFEGISPDKLLKLAGQFESVGYQRPLHDEGKHTWGSLYCGAQP